MGAVQTEPWTGNSKRLKPSLNVAPTSKYPALVLKQASLTCNTRGQGQLHSDWLEEAGGPAL